MALEYNDDEALVIEADLPGIDPDHDIDITIAHDVLHIQARRHAGLGPNDHFSDLRYGTFSRYIGLPPGTAEDQITATYRDGRLEVRAPSGGAAETALVRVKVTHDQTERD